MNKALIQYLITAGVAVSTSVLSFQALWNRHSHSVDEFVPEDIPEEEILPDIDDAE